MKTQPSNWLQMSDALKTLAAGYEKLDLVERNGGLSLPSISLNGKSNGHSNGHGNGHAVAKALPVAQKVKKAAVKALPAPTAELAVQAKTPKAKAAKAPKAPKAVAKAPKAAKEPKQAKAPKVKAAKAPKAAPANAIAAGRRAVSEGLRPKLVEAVAIVMGSETLKAGEILARLVERGWEPGASAKQAYISYTLSDNEEVFKRLERGAYSVKSPKNYVELAEQWKSGKVTPKAKEVVAKAAPKAKASAKAAAPKAKKAKGGKTSGKAEGVASTDTGEAEVLATASQSEVTQAPEVKTEAAPVAGDPPTTTSDAPSSSDTSQALEGLGIGESEIGESPFDSLNN